MSTFLKGDSPSDYTHKLSIDRENIEFHKTTRDQTGNLRIDYLFSYWVYVWFLIYIFVANNPTSKWNKYIVNNFNPLLALIFALLENLVVFVLLVLYNPDYWLIVKYMAMLIFIKIVPIYMLKDVRISWWRDLKYLALLFLLYNFHLYLEGTDIFSIYNRSVVSLLKNQDRTPMMAAFKYISNNVPFIGKHVPADILE